MAPQIAKRGHELYEGRGRAVQDWGETEREIRKYEPHKETGANNAVGVPERMSMEINSKDFRVRPGDLSMFKKERERAGAMYLRPVRRFTGDCDTFLEQLRRALYAAKIIAYAQGLVLLLVASAKYEYPLDLEAVARIRRGGRIIRAALLEDIGAAFRSRRDLPNLLHNPNISSKVLEYQEYLRQVVCQPAESGVPPPGLMVSLGYLDAYRGTWLPANLVQAQRDYFGAHTYERIDAKGTFHTEWEEK